jgi:cytidylate kinase
LPADEVPAADRRAAPDGATRARPVGSGEVQRTVILIDGRSGSGKSTLAPLVAAALETPAQLIRLDDIYPGWGGLAAGSRHVLENVLVPLAEGRPSRWRRWDWTADAAAEWHAVDPTAALVIEGAGILTRANRALATFGIWVELDDETRKRRALARDGDLYAPHWHRWAAQEEAFLARERPRLSADLLIDGHRISG